MNLLLLFAALRRQWINELSIGGLVKDSEGHLEIPLLLLLLCAASIGRKSLLLAIGEPVTLLKTFLGSPNGTKDCILEEFLLKGKAPLCLHNEVDRDVDLKWGLGEILYLKRNENKKSEKYFFIYNA